VIDVWTNSLLVWQSSCCISWIHWYYGVWGWLADWNSMLN